MDHQMHKAFQLVEIAKEKIISCDYTGARKKLQEIRFHFPAFDNISAMITVCDILHSASYGFLGSNIDCYWVLEVCPDATEFHIRNKYNNFLTLLDPIKSQFPGAASALNIIRGAFAVLSDPERRAMFDRKRAMRLQSYGSGNLRDADVVDLQQNVKKQKPSSKSARSQCETWDGTSDVDIVSKAMFDNDGVSNHLQQMEGPNLCGFPVDYDTGEVAKGISDILFQQEIYGGPGQPEAKTNYYYDFHSKEISPDIYILTGKNHDYYKLGDVRKTENFAVGQVWATYDDEGMPRKYAMIINIKTSESPNRIYINWLKPAPKNGIMKRWFEAGLPIVCGVFNVDGNQASHIEPISFSHMLSLPAASKQVKIFPRKGEIWAIYKDWRLQEWCWDHKSREGSRLQMVQILTEYSDPRGLVVVGMGKVEGLGNVYSTCYGNDYAFKIPASNLFMFSHRVPAYKLAEEEMDILNSFVATGSPRNSIITPSFSTLPSGPGSETEPSGQERSAEDFTAGQIWAVYEGQDSMPRSYVIVNNVASKSEVSVTFLEPHPTNIDEINWTKKDLPFACGFFKAGETSMNLGLPRFSHKVKCERSTDTALYKVFPNRGEIWAMYKNWSVGWTADDFTNCKCQIVEILTDLGNESEVIAASLEEVPGCLTFFRRQICDGFELVWGVPRNEMLSFSHQIPAFTVKGAEVHDIPQGSWHLEPNALPPNFNTIMATCVRDKLLLGLRL